MLNIKSSFSAATVTTSSYEERQVGWYEEVGRKFEVLGFFPEGCLKSAGHRECLERSYHRHRERQAG